MATWQGQSRARSQHPSLDPDLLTQVGLGRVGHSAAYMLLDATWALAQALKGSGHQQVRGRRVSEGHTAEKGRQRTRRCPQPCHRDTEFKSRHAGAQSGEVVGAEPCRVWVRDLG